MRFSAVVSICTLGMVLVFSGCSLLSKQSNSQVKLLPDTKFEDLNLEELRRIEKKSKESPNDLTVEEKKFLSDSTELFNQAAEGSDERIKKSNLAKMDSRCHQFYDLYAKEDAADKGVSLDIFYSYKANGCVFFDIENDTPTKGQTSFHVYNTNLQEVFPLKTFPVGIYDFNSEIERQNMLQEIRKVALEYKASDSNFLTGGTLEALVKNN